MPFLYRSVDRKPGFEISPTCRFKMEKQCTDEESQVGKPGGSWEISLPLGLT